MEERARRGRGGERGLGRPARRTSTSRSSEDLDEAKTEMRDVKREEMPTEHVCEKCGKPMVIKWGRNGQFLACTGLPRVPQHHGLHGARTGRSSQEKEEDVQVDEKCPKCGSRHGDEARPLRPVPRVLPLPGVQDQRARSRSASRAPRAAAATSPSGARAAARPSTAAPRTRTATSSPGIARGTRPAPSAGRPTSWTSTRSATAPSSRVRTRNAAIAGPTSRRRSPRASRRASNACLTPRRPC